MKKFLLIALVAIFTISAVTIPSIEVKAQSTKLISKSAITTADTINFLSVPSKIKSFSYTLLKTSGTVAGKVYLEAGSLTNQWETLDSLTLANVTTLQVKTVIITATNYLNYRWRNTNTSSATAAVKASYLRRTDE